jgi:hypothetical protein
MDIIVSNMDSTPIYEQITRQIKAKILGGAAGGGAAVYAPAGEGTAHQRYHDQACV